MSLIWVIAYWLRLMGFKFLPGQKYRSINKIKYEIDNIVRNFTNQKRKLYSNHTNNRNEDGISLILVQFVFQLQIRVPPLMNSMSFLKILIMGRINS